MNLFGLSDTEPHIFANRDTLKDLYQPDEIVGRDEEKQELANALRPVLKGTGSPDNIFISGPAGTGKTVLARSMMDQITANPELDVMVKRVNCEPINGGTSLLLSIANTFRESGNKLSTTGYKEEQAVDAFFSELREVGEQTVLIVLDELDTVDNLGKFLYYVPRAHEFDVDTDVGLVSISNDPDFIRDVPEDVRQTLTDVHVQFAEYDASDIRAVLTQRATLAFRDTTTNDMGEVESPVLDHSALALAAAKGTQNSGNARMARDVLRAAGDLALDRGDDCVADEHVLDAANTHHEERMTKTVRDFSGNTKAVLYALITLYTDGRDAPRTAEIQTRYHKLTERAGMDPVGNRTIHNYLKKFERIGLTECVNHGGASGRYITHALQYDVEPILDGLGEVMDFYGVHTSLPVEGADMELETDADSLAD